MESIVKIIDGLKRPSAYGNRHKVDEVKVVQTHISVVFLAGDFVYKVKKPVDFGFLDFSTLEKRKHYCNEEVRLNRRLCPDIYLDVATVNDHNGEIAVGGAGKVIDYAVVMKRMPESGMMDLMLERGEVTKDHITMIAEVLARFYERAKTGEGVDEFGTAEAITVNTAENFDQTYKYIGETIDRDTYDDIKNFTDNFYLKKADLIKSRIDEGFIREGHGDLHSKNICIAKGGVYIYDCIEFNERFRIGDVANDIAFLAMDLDFHLHPGLSTHFVNEYIRLTGDTRLFDMLKFYACYRAFVRGKVLSFQLDGAEISDEGKERAKSEARLYFALSHYYAVSEKRPFLAITFGFSGTGKSGLTRIVAEETGAELISSDVVRKSLFGIKPDEHVYEAPGEGIYSSDVSKRTYDEIFGLARETLAGGRPVILDATFLKEKGRRDAKEFAQETGSRFFVIETTCPEEVAKKRIVKRMEKGSYSDATVDVYERQLEEMEPLSVDEREFAISVDTTAPKGVNVRTVLRYILLNDKGKDGGRR
ncbi:MAG: AAA family ATPase [Deltaproteobacteria bacterium]|uniref:AAA family ATPase n=1 Tax=Candidatus Zymogenus saltonus TaxID=2844893 RepID=A0A9D8KHN8_9DELT|nr:AAA family ATPase [Candidatus Zymogenus saltonus]